MKVLMLNQGEVRRLLDHDLLLEALEDGFQTVASASALAAADPRAYSVESYEAAVRGADVVALCTHSGEPVVRREWLSPGTHLASVGLASAHGELDRAIAEDGKLYVESRAAAFEPPPAGCLELTGIAPEAATEMGELLLGSAPGREDPEELTVYQSMGHAIEDVVAAALVDAAALQDRVGVSFDL